MLPQHCSSEHFLPITTQILYALYAQNSHFPQGESFEFVFRSFLSYLLSCLSIHALNQFDNPSLSFDLFSGSLLLKISFIPSVSLRYSKMVSVWLQRAALHPDISHIMKRRIYLHWDQQVRLREKGELRGMSET